MIDLKQRQLLISNFPCFAFKEHELAEFAELWTEIEYHPGDVIVTEGDIVNSIFIIIEGTAEVILKEKAESGPIAIINSGEGIGLDKLGFFSTTGFRTATVIAKSNLIALEMSISKLNQFFEKYPKLNQVMAKASKQMLRMMLIKGAAPFIKLTQNQIHWLEQRIAELQFKTNDLIFSEGDIGDSCFLIYTGKVSIFTFDDETQKEQTLAELGKSDLFGEIALMTAAPRNASARAIEPTTLLVLYKKDFLKLMNQHKAAQEAITTSIIERMRPVINKQIIIFQRQTVDAETLITLKNPTNDKYYLLSAEGWFVFEHLNGKHSIQSIIKSMQKELNIVAPEFVYDLITDLITGEFIFFTSDKKIDFARYTTLTYDEEGFEETISTNFEECFPVAAPRKVTWIDIQGLNDITIFNEVIKYYHLNDVITESIINVEQLRPKIQVLDNYIFIMLRALQWDKKQHQFIPQPVSLILGKSFVLSFQKSDIDLFAIIKNFVTTRKGEYIRKQGPDFLIYRLIDTIVDQYFEALEKIGDEIDELEERLLIKPESQNSKELYLLKRQVLIIRKAIWPLREAVSHLLHHVDHSFIAPSTAIYYRDLYDRVAQALDTVETFRDILSGMLDAYLSSLSMRMNEVMKVLTIISTIFIPITFLTGLFGMNFVNMPELRLSWGFRSIEFLMLLIVFAMLIYFRRKKWI